MLSPFWPEPVLLSLGGSDRLVSQFQLRDLAKLERFATDGGVVAYWRDLAAAESMQDDAARRTRLRALYEHAEKGLPWFGSSGVAEALSSPLGRLESLYLNLVKATPDLTRQDVAPTALAMRLEEWILFDRVAWAADPLDETARVIDTEIDVEYIPGKSDVTNWHKLLCQISRRTGWTLAQIGDLYLSQWNAVLSAGKAIHPYAEPTNPPSGKSMAWLDEHVNAPRRKFWTKING